MTFSINIINTKGTKVSFSEIKTINVIYQKFIEQEFLNANKFFIMSSSDKYFETLKYLSNYDGNKFGLIIPAETNIPKK